VLARRLSPSLLPDGDVAFGVSGNYGAQDGVVDRLPRLG